MIAEQLIDALGEVTNSFLKKIKTAASKFNGLVPVAFATGLLVSFDSAKDCDKFASHIHSWKGVTDYAVSPKGTEILVLEKGGIDDVPGKYSQWGRGSR